jgi:hypothetical protein
MLSERFCKILFSYTAYMLHIRYLLYLTNKYNIRYYGYGNLNQLNYRNGIIKLILKSI